MITKPYGLDFETFSETDLPERGRVNYMNDDSFEAILASLAYPDGTVRRFDFVFNPSERKELLEELTRIHDEGSTIAAHNAGFERGVLAVYGWNHPEAIVDSAVMARLLGMGSKLEVAAPQLTGLEKLEVGKELIQKFCVPHEGYTGPTTEYMTEHAEDWEDFGEYCDVDALGSQDIVYRGMQLLEHLDSLQTWYDECDYEILTWRQNIRGWKVDVTSLEWMAKRSWANSEIAKMQFVQEVGADLNFNSHPQMKAFAKERGFTYASLAKEHAPAVLERITELVETTEEPEQKRKYQEVQTMLELKLEIGGSTLTKIPTILAVRDHEDIVRDVYVHVGAGQSFRTTSMKVQMQNLSKLDKEIRDLTTLQDYSVEWTNTQMAKQLRQVFMSRHEEGHLIVGDYSAVESRGLAYLAGEQWKLDSYEKKLDVYKVLVTKYNNIDYDEVTDEMRPKGKYTELSCGYQASAKAVKDLMLKYGFVISIEEAAVWVNDWRNANPNVVAFWAAVDKIMHRVVATHQESTLNMAQGLKLVVTPFQVPSLQALAPNSTSLCFKLYFPDGTLFMTRFIHGAHKSGRGIAIYKPAEYANEAALWTKVNKTATQKANKGRSKNLPRKTVLHSIYGGKMVGILTQSFCRNMFFEGVTYLEAALEARGVTNAMVIGQFHDEMIIDWWPGEHSLEEVKAIVNEAMSYTSVPGFPLVAEIKNAHRYIK